VALLLKNGLYQGTFRAPANTSRVADRVYGVTIQATSLTGAQATQDCGTITVARANAS
jgi:hypothetical protein